MLDTRPVRLQQDTELMLYGSMKGLLAEVWEGVVRLPDLNLSRKPLLPQRMKRQAEESGEQELWRRDAWQMLYSGRDSARGMAAEQEQWGKSTLTSPASLPFSNPLQVPITG